jgi:translation initiation factor 2 gamma subunit (eIF-2gamma)
MEVLVNVTRILLSQIVVLPALLDLAGAGESAPSDSNQPQTREHLLDLSTTEMREVPVIVSVSYSSPRAVLGRIHPLQASHPV